MVKQWGERFSKGCLQLRTWSSVQRPLSLWHSLNKYKTEFSFSWFSSAAAVFLSVRSKLTSSITDRRQNGTRSERKFLCNLLKFSLALPQRLTRIPTFSSLPLLLGVKSGDLEEELCQVLVQLRSQLDLSCDLYVLSLPCFWPESGRWKTLNANTGAFDDWRCLLSSEDSLIIFVVYTTLPNR